MGSWLQQQPLQITVSFPPSPPLSVIETTCWTSVALRSTCLLYGSYKYWTLFLFIWFLIRLQQRIKIKDSLLVDIAVGCWSLGADAVVGVLGELGVQDEAGSVHQVVEVAVVGPVVQQGQRLRLGVGLHKNRQDKKAWWCGTMQQLWQDLLSTWGR